MECFHGERLIGNSRQISLRIYKIKNEKFNPASKNKKFYKSDQPREQSLFSTSTLNLQQLVGKSDNFLVPAYFFRLQRLNQNSKLQKLTQILLN